MIPSNLIALAIITVAVLPGSMYTWAFERQVSAYGSTLAPRSLRKRPPWMVRMLLVAMVIIGLSGCSQTQPTPRDVAGEWSQGESTLTIEENGQFTAMSIPSFVLPSEGGGELKTGSGNWTTPRDGYIFLTFTTAEPTEYQGVGILLAMRQSERRWALTASNESAEGTPVLTLRK